MTEQTSQNQVFEQDDLFNLTMEKKWEEVAKMYRIYPEARKAKLTKSEETALHIAVSSYNAKRPTSTAHVNEMIEVVDDEVFSMKNDKGDTPLHLAAAVGWAAVCEQMALKSWMLIKERNANGETPLFVAAHYGNLQAFLCLHKVLCDQNCQPDETLCRRKDGNTILHSAISGEYFRLAYQIICYYKNLVNSFNIDGETPLHVLARKPNVFKSSSHFGFYDSFIHYCVIVDDLKEEKYNPRAQNGYTPGGEIDLPENYRTCVDVFFLLWTPIIKSFPAGFPRFKKGSGNPTDVESPQPSGNESENEDTHRERKRAYPPNYTTCVLLFKFAMKVILTVVGVGFWRIKKIREKKERYYHASQIMNKMIELEAGYTYDSNGQRPVPRFERDHAEGLPDTPPHADAHDDLQRIDTNDRRGTSSSERQSGSRNDQIEPEGTTPNVLLKKDSDTALLVAARMGIPEMVKKIISKCPVAFEDLDSKGKNVLMLAAENRQTTVFDYLLKINLPEYMFHQLDDEGNSVLHLAAMLGDLQPWSIPGAALQMQWEIKWFKHVKRLVPPLSFALNTKGETPRKTFTRTHQKLVKEGNDWLVKTSESCSVVAALIAAVAFATAATVPGGLDQVSGYPILQHEHAFDVFSITSLIALCLSVTALVFFLAIITSRCEERDFKTNLPNKLLLGLTSLFAAIAAMLVSFCSGHTLILSEKLKIAAWPIYTVASLPVTFFAIAQLPLYFDLLWATCRRVPLRSYKVFY